MSDMREDMLRNLARHRATKAERSKALWKMSADERVSAISPIGQPDNRTARTRACRPAGNPPNRALACQVMEHRSQIPIKIASDGKPVRSETLATSGGAYILAIETVLPDQAIDLHSVYTGHANTQTQATHLMLTPDRREAITVEHDHDQLPVMYARRTCLYDHLHQLQSLLQAHGIDAQLPIDDDAIAAVEH